MSSQHAVGRGRIVYAALDFLLAIIYLVIFLKLVPSRSSLSPYAIAVSIVSMPADRASRRIASTSSPAMRPH